MKKIQSLFFALILTACATPTPAPTVTAIPPTPSATATATLLPTSALTLTPTPSADADLPVEVGEVKEYPICEIKDFRDCVIPVEDLYPKEGEETGAYDKWLATLSKPFEEGKIDTRPWDMSDSRGLLNPNTDTKRAPGTISLWKDITAGVTEMDGLQYRIVPLQFPDPSDPTNPAKNIRVIGFKLMNYIKGGKLGKPLSGGSVTYITQEIIDMKIMPIVNGFQFPDTGVTIPLAERTWKTTGAEKMADIFKRAAAGDITALRELRGMPVLIYTGNNPRYQ